MGRLGASRSNTSGPSSTRCTSISGLPPRNPRERMNGHRVRSRVCKWRASSAGVALSNSGPYAWLGQFATRATRALFQSCITVEYSTSCKLRMSGTSPARLQVRRYHEGESCLLSCTAQSPGVARAIFRKCAHTSIMRVQLPSWSSRENGVMVSASVSKLGLRPC
jgi:hypothetical protein